MMLSAEFVESAVIFLYGGSNVWLEHLSNSSGEWAAMDLEHVSINLLFFGGGLVCTWFQRYGKEMLARHVD